jgi:hypothetical protein
MCPFVDVVCCRELDQRFRCNLGSTVAITSRNRISRIRGFHCHCSLHYEIPIPESSMAYLPRSFCRSDSCQSFGKSHWISVFLLLYKLLLCAFSSMLFLLSFYVRIPKGFYPSYPAISIVAIKDNNHQHSSTRIRCLFNVCQQSETWSREKL